MINAENKYRGMMVLNTKLGIRIEKLMFELKIGESLDSSNGLSALCL